MDMHWYAAALLTVALCLWSIWLAWRDRVRSALAVHLAALLGGTLFLWWQGPSAAAAVLLPQLIIFGAALAARLWRDRRGRA